MAERRNVQAISTSPRQTLVSFERWRTPCFNAGFDSERLASRPFGTRLYSCSVHLKRRAIFASPYGTLEIGHLRYRKTGLALTRRFAPPSPTRRGRTISGGVLNQRFHARRCHCIRKSVCSLEVSALMWDLSLALGERVVRRTADPVRVNPPELVLKMSKL